jgi:hypothetical protein
MPLSLTWLGESYFDLWLCVRRTIHWSELAPCACDLMICSCTWDLLVCNCTALHCPSWLNKCCWTLRVIKLSLSGNELSAIFFACSAIFYLSMQYLFLLGWPYILKFSRTFTDLKCTICVDFIYENDGICIRRVRVTTSVWMLARLQCSETRQKCDVKIRRSRFAHWYEYT